MSPNGDCLKIPNKWVYLRRMFGFMEKPEIRIAI